MLESSELQAETSNRLPLAIIIGVCFYSILSEILPFKNADILNNELFGNIFKFYNNENVSYVTSKFLRWLFSRNLTYY